MRNHVATLQTIWDCRFSHPGYRLHGVKDSEQPETLWVCTRIPGRRRRVTDAECEYCENWEAEDPDEADFRR
jgi:hypothetical protein